jgi:hypothetical protein
MKTDWQETWREVIGCEVNVGVSAVVKDWILNKADDRLSWPISFQINFVRRDLREDIKNENNVT